MKIGVDMEVRGSRTSLPKNMKKTIEGKGRDINMGYAADDMIKAAKAINIEGINHPSYYNQGIEAIDYIESHNMNFNLGNVIKYITRCEHKENKVKDLEKAKFYIQREIDKATDDEKLDLFGGING